VEAPYLASSLNRLSEGKCEHETRDVRDEQQAAHEPSASLHDCRPAPLLDDLERSTADHRGGVAA
jgi:hypothetical protein